MPLLTDQSASPTRDAYDTWHGSHLAHSGVPCEPEEPWYQSAVPHITDQACGAFLEIGCGRGEFAVWLAKTVPALKITAIDFSEAAIRTAVERAQEVGVGVDFRQEDAQALALPDASFDYVLSCECLEHVPEPRRVAAELFRVLKPGARFCLTTENYLNGMILGWVHSWVTGKPFNSGSGVQPHENFFLFWQVYRYLRSAGLVIDKTASCHVQWLLLPGVDPGRLCTKHFSKPLARILAKPFGRHFSFFGHKPIT